MSKKSRIDDRVLSFAERAGPATQLHIERVQNYEINKTLASSRLED